MKNVRTLGIAVVLALALTAVAGVASASANWFKVGVEPATWSGSINGSNHLFIVGGEALSCSESSFSAEVKNKSFKEVTVPPKLKCNFPGPFLASIETNGCKFRFHAGPGPTATGTMDIVECAKPMRISGGGAFCEIEVGNQKGLGPITYASGGGSPLTVTATAGIKSITYTSKGCFENGTRQNGTYSGKWTIKAATLPGGIPAAAEFESTAASFSFFDLEEAPATLAASSTGVAQRITSIPGMEFSCESFSLNGTSASTGSETLTLFPTYKNCTIGGVVAESNWFGSSCNFVIHGNGKFDLAGTEECASGKLTISKPGCAVQFPPQAGLSGVTYSNQGSGKLRTITLGGTVTKLKYATGGPFCSKYGEFTDGTIAMSGKLTATNSGGVGQGISVE